MSKIEKIEKINTLLKDFISNRISLTQKDITESAKSREWFLEKLKNKIHSEERKNEPFLFLEKPFVKFGSYFKGTKVANVDEYDVLVVIDSCSGVFRNPLNHIGTGKGTVNPNPKYHKKYYKTDESGVSPSKMLNWLKKVTEEVVEEFGGEAPERDGQAVTAIIKSKNIKIDLVPAGVFSYNNSNNLFYNIPNGKSDNSWILTNPHEDIELINKLSQDRDNFKNVIRIIKFIRDQYRISISSFAIESSIVNFALNKEWSNALLINLLNVLLYLGQQIDDGEIYDTHNSKNNLIENIPEASRNLYKERFFKVASSLLDLVDKHIDDYITYEKIEKILCNL